MNTTVPETFIEAIRYFNDEDRCIGFMAAMRWPNGEAICPTCGRVDVSYLEKQKRWQCKSTHPKRQFSAKTSTIFEDSPIGLDRWLPAVWEVVNDKNGISSYEMARKLGTTQKTAWFMSQRIREAMKKGSLDKLDGEIENDETFPGGKFKNMHKSKLKAKGRGPVGKPVVFGMLQRGGDVRAMVVPDRTRDTLHSKMQENIAEGATVYTDAFVAYNGLEKNYTHRVVDHNERYVNEDGITHTNSIEGFWNLFKRSYKGTYTHLSLQHLDRYLLEHTYRYNSRNGDDAERFRQWFTGCERRLTYKMLTAKANQPLKMLESKGSLLLALSGVTITGALPLDTDMPF